MHSLVSAYGALGSIEMEIATSHSKVHAIERALRDAEKCVAEAQNHLKTALIASGQTIKIRNGGINDRK